MDENKVVSISLSTSSQNGKKETMNFTYVNPQATNEQITTFANMIIGLSTNTLLTTTKITKELII